MDTYLSQRKSLFSPLKQPTRFQNHFDISSTKPSYRSYMRNSLLQEKPQNPGNGSYYNTSKRNMSPYSHSQSNTNNTYVSRGRDSDLLKAPRLNYSYRRSVSRSNENRREVLNTINTLPNNQAQPRLSYRSISPYPVKSSRTVRYPENKTRYVRNSYKSSKPSITRVVHAPKQTRDSLILSRNVGLKPDISESVKEEMLMPQTRTVRNGSRSREPFKDTSKELNIRDSIILNKSRFTEHLDYKDEYLTDYSYHIDYRKSVAFVDEPNRKRRGSILKSGGNKTKPRKKVSFAEYKNEEYIVSRWIGDGFISKRQRKSGILKQKNRTPSPLKTNMETKLNQAQRSPLLQLQDGRYYRSFDSQVLYFD